MSLDDKSQAAVERLEVTPSPPLAVPEYCHEALSDGQLLVHDIRPAAERRLVRKLDMRLLPTIVLIYAMNYIDRASITSARLQGLPEDLGLSDIQYDTILAILYVTYVPTQLPSNMILNRIPRPSYYIALCVFLWGTISALTGVTRNYTSILVTRLCLGIPEAAFYPGAIYLLSRWYTRKELALRCAILYAGFLFATAFGSGAVTIAIGLLTLYLLPDYPHNTRWLSPAERRLAQVRLAEDAGEADEDVATETAFNGLVMALKDKKVYLFAVVSCSQLLGLSFSSFLPTILGTLGYGTTVTLLLMAPPALLAAAICIMSAWHADRTGERYLHLCVPWWGTIIAYVIWTSTMSVGGRYSAVFLMLDGFSGCALTLAWLSNAVPRPPAKRSAAIGIVNGFGNIGALMGSFIWKSTWGPGYRPSMIICMASLALATVVASIIRCILVQQNKDLEREEQNALTGAQRDRIAEAARLEGITFEEALRRQQGFRYLL
ncbi:MFS general substrate transporter [Daedaleopsis nitida]|nr:MFS general substrate transporter [Daedaleopsis nitida]